MSGTGSKGQEFVLASWVETFQAKIAEQQAVIDRLLQHNKEMQIAAYAWPHNEAKQATIAAQEEMIARLIPVLEAADRIIPFVPAKESAQTAHYAAPSTQRRQIP